MSQDWAGRDFARKAEGRVAVLVDGENVGQDFADQIARAAAAFGQPVISRVYGNAARIPKWDGVPGFRLIHSGCGKNATDLLLCIDAMELSFGGSVNAFVIVSSDRDFTHLATRLRERCGTVVGMGEAKTSLTFRAACSAFIELTAPPAANPPAKVLHPPAKPLNALDRNIHDLIRREGDGGALAMACLGGRMFALHQTRIKDQTEKTWRAYLSSPARSHLYLCDEKGPTARVRLRQGPATAAPASAI